MLCPLIGAGGYLFEIRFAWFWCLASGPSHKQDILTIELLSCRTWPRVDQNWEIWSICSKPVSFLWHVKQYWTGQNFGNPHWMVNAKKIRILNHKQKQTGFELQETPRLKTCLQGGCVTWCGRCTNGSWWGHHPSQYNQWKWVGRLRTTLAFIQFRQKGFYT